MNSRLRTLLAATLLAATATTATATAAEPEWINQFGTELTDQARGVAVGPDGRVTVVGRTYGRFFGAANKGDYDAFVVTFDGDGRELWRRQPGTSELDNALDVATDADGNIYVVGYTDGALGGADMGEGDAFVIKFDRDGRQLWKRQPGTSAYDFASAVATDADGNVYVLGYTEGPLGGGEMAANDAFVIKFDRDGRQLWKRQPGTTAYDNPFDVATDADGNVYVVGFTEGALGGAKKGGQFDYDTFVIKFDPDGRILWKRQPGTTSRDIAFGVATDADRNVYVVGSTEGALGGASKGRRDAFVLKFDRDGRILWKRQPGTGRSDEALGVATDADGNLYVVGRTEGALGGAKKGGRFDYDTFVMKYDRDGHNVWRDQPGTSENEYASAVATDADGNVYLAGWTEGALPGNTNAGGEDAFLIKYGPDGPQ